MQGFSVTIPEIEVRPMDGASARQKAAQALHHGLHGRLVGQGAGHVQQSSIAIFCVRHNTGAQTVTHNPGGRAISTLGILVRSRA